MNERIPPLIPALFVAAALAIVASLALDSPWAAPLAAMIGVGAGMILADHSALRAGSTPTPTPPPPPPDLLDMAGFTRIIDGLADPVLVTDRNKVVLANSAAKRVLGGHIVGEDIRVAIRHPAAAERLAGEAVTSGPSVTDIVGLGARDQRWRMEIVPIETTETRQRLLVRLVDMSAAYDVERTRVDFVANASHELRTPLAVILGYVETLGDPAAGGDQETRDRFLSIVGNEARRMQQLVDDLISLSRIEADKHRSPETPVDLGQLAREVASVLGASLGPRGKDIVVRSEPYLPEVLGDRAQLSQVMHNLLGNSAKYGTAGKPITVTLAPAPPGLVRIEVQDEGDGIPPEHLHRLTERFYRVDSGRSRAMGGTGLGLAIVKHIVERHRGRMDIASVAGKGTTVTVLLPIAPPLTERESGEIVDADAPSDR